MAGIRLSRLTVNGERVSTLFAKALSDIGRESEDWTIREDGDGVYVRLVAAAAGDEALFFGLEEFVVTKIPDQALELRIRDYQDTILDRQT